MDQWQLLVCNIETLKQEHGRRKNSVAISSMSEVLQIRLLDDSDGIHMTWTTAKMAHLNHPVNI